MEKFPLYISIILTLAVLYFVGKDVILGQPEAYVIVADGQGGIWRTRQSDGKVSYCTAIPNLGFPKDAPVCTPWGSE